MPVAMDLTRFAAVTSVPAAFTLGWLSFAQLLVVSVIVAAADIALLVLRRRDNARQAGGSWSGASHDTPQLAAAACSGHVESERSHL